MKRRGLRHLKCDTTLSFMLIVTGVQPGHDEADTLWRPRRLGSGAAKFPKTGHLKRTQTQAMGCPAVRRRRVSVWRVSGTSRWSSRRRFAGLC